MLGLFFAVAVSGSFTAYPVYTQPEASFEAIIDRGPILEIIVNCYPNSAIMSYGKIDGKYCIASGDCFGEINSAYAATCG